MENNQPMLTEEMQMFDYWSRVYSPADQHIDSLRAAYDAFQQHYTLPRTEGMCIEDHTLTLATHRIDMRVFTPEENAPEAGWSWIFYVHGGGNVVGSADSHEYIARQLARDLKVKVFLVEYGLVPEFDWSQGQQDCLDAYQLILQQAATWNINTVKGSIVADGSGAALALQVQQQLLVEQQPQTLALIFPSFFSQHSTTQQQSLVYQIEDQQLMQTWTGVSAQQALRTVPELKHAVPHSFIALTQYDVCHAENAVLLQQLQQCNIPVEVYTGMGLKGNCLPLLRDCHEAASVYEALLKFLQPNF
ncbi:alpha/beta hydrolase [Acinetobacter wuhouensis]|uniref:Alpha/beta hydrolase n=1 Tax=Acinetobacter wuhouensis TaxID=1879050 RepID=A0A4Q7AG27_9GAMM|nr:alpha/beta hydrolase [Acinetobacter wuhouensis]RZG46396.1 alpha/beta hydrolase [Acinetobacter wuhouensis]RZG75934.1 alpha/beta hydrolase [Acinetobacter wuhouensis]